MGIFDFFTKKETENILKSPEYQCKCNLLELNKRIEADRYQNLDNIQAASFIKELEILYTNFSNNVLYQKLVIMENRTI